MRKYKNIESLQKAIDKKEELLIKAKKESTNKFNNIGFGHSMRCTRINISFSKEDKLRDDLREMYILLDEMEKELSYYEKELNNINILKDDIITIQLIQNNKQTKNLGLNLESIQYLRSFLNKLEKQLKKAN